MIRRRSGGLRVAIRVSRPSEAPTMCVAPSRLIVGRDRSRNSQLTPQSTPSSVRFRFGSLFINHGGTVYADKVR
jgi:hypothetical protein